MSDSKLVHVPIEVMSKPKDGEVMLDRYWCVHPDKGLAYWDRGGKYFHEDRYSPQCNSDKRVSDHLVGIHKDHVIVKVPAVYTANLRAALDRRNQCG